MFHKSIIAKHEDICAKCGYGIMKDMSIVWVPKECKVYHIACFNNAPKYRFTQDKLPNRPVED